ncbi:hypothetical protein DXX93_20525 [Thalassotalea euphylliae]|uniref:Uncharacterized protein n=1 Tax=Thalassotalea euphylliae TaxID=1655234 RepID=A0A3E0TWH2_9GAMM|nr:DUF6482 family protein [Thalassotalea euphylliae]REL28717.1 hypothetical protein DXX93_20525 [Thalassotalea euphylliae]
MKLLYKDLRSKRIDKLIINSLEQALYQALVVIDDTEHMVWLSADKTLTTRNLTKMREHFEKLEIKEIVLRHESAYDEMVGQPTKQGNNRLEVPLRQNPYAVLKHLH